jgi:hypothetical protein
MCSEAIEYIRSKGWRSWNTLQIHRPGVSHSAIFRPGQAYPSVIAKLYESSQSTERGRREARALETLQPVASELGIPRLLFQADTPAGFLTLQSGVPGDPWPDQVATKSRWSRQLAAASSWLEQFQSRVLPKGTVDDAMLEFIASCSSRLADLTSAERTFLSASRQVLPVLSQVPAVAVHGDFWAANILDHDRRLSVVDWSTFYYGGGTDDLLAFLAAGAWRMALTPVEMGRHFWRAFFEPSPLGDLVRPFTSATRQRLHIAPSASQALFMLFLMSRLARPEFVTHPAWRAFVSQYVAAGMPPPVV